MNLNTVDLLLKNGCIVTQDDQRSIVEDGAIAIRDGLIVALGTTKDIAPQYQPEEMIDLDNQIVFPGLVNTHTHLFQVGTKGLGEDMPVQAWINAVTAPTAVNISPEEMYTFCLTGCLEHIHSGVTTLVDMSYTAHTYALHEQNIQAMCDSGLRGRYSTMVLDYGVEYGILPELIRPIEWFIEEFTKLHDQFPASDRMAVWIAVGAPFTATDLGLKKTLSYSIRTGTPIVMHINENQVANDLSQQRYGKNIVPYLDEIGFLKPDLLAIHCVVTDERDIELYVKHDVKISYNPVSNMYLGSGIAPILEMEKAGLTIGLGVDGAGSNNSQDMIETMKVAALLQKVGACDASVVDAQKVLDWATRDAARALGLEEQIGSLEVGKRADLFVMAINSAKVVPVHDPVATLVYSSGEENVVMTIAEGKTLMKDRIIQNIDEQDMLERCQAAATDLANRCGSNSRLKRRWHYR